jgi:lysophospholipase L1-like esterase
MRFSPWVRLAIACALAVLGAAALDALVFRTPWYVAHLEPDSSTGVFESVLARERDAQRHNGDNMVVTLGDSRFAYAPRLANQVGGQTGYVFRHAGVAGTDARSWYYMMRDLDPTRRRYRAVVIGVNDYGDEDEEFNPNDDIRALHYVIARLRLRDVPEFARSFDSLALQWEAFRGSIWKGMTFQADMLDFLAHPQWRLGKVALNRRFFEFWTYGYVETDRSMAGLAIDWKTMTATMPPGLDEDQVATVNNALLRAPAPQTGRLAAFRRHWLGKIIDLYRGSPTRIVFLRLPRGPVVRPDRLVHKLSSSIRELARRPNVMLAPEHAFDSLEHPELFRDALHLNREGIARFSPMMAGEIGRLLDAAAAQKAAR